jgi:hypothetical protein
MHPTTVVVLVDWRVLPRKSRQRFPMLADVSSLHQNPIHSTIDMEAGKKDA